ncbi:non-ribosomal peptide synthetase [Mucilaginibacter myungsuensis]|uniref:Amino acid adenylation domain-containing protein n=1 Tax=Mucilaginibacter myungsuensis TaxID=649104 RepID=A0A929L527_9SPHI|nr:non-ribosomal peptide synthetase [Mucilaginibacter myungsuensis]MBE9663376.1 amino acid adenylation domain-containing protein [Mucilaginibacter myungsuensis]MDN3600113.1 amino acid adenylation domain-containing protein [Mucilaginibacter myungsuensis]
MDTTELKDQQFVPVDFDPFAGPELSLFAPATEPQMEIWLSCKLGGQEASCAYNESFALRLHGAVDIEILKRAVEALVTRHESLRSVFSPNGASMLTYSYLAPELSVEDLSSKHPNILQSSIDGYIDSTMKTPFDLVNGPLFRVKIFKQDAQLYTLILTVHHIICDGWSFGVIMQELSKYYSAFLANTVPNLAVAPKFSQYAQDQANFPATADYQEIETFWLDQYKEYVPVVDLPTDRARPAMRTFASKHYKKDFEPGLTAAIKQLASKAGCSLVTVLLAGFETWLQHVTGQDEVVVGVPAAGQLASGNIDLVGHCVNLLPVKSTMDSESTFLQYLKQRRPQILDAYDHQMITFGQLIKKLNISRDPSRVPLVPVVFNSDMGMNEGIIFQNLTHELFPVQRKFENFEIFINVNDIGSGLTMDWGYTSALFDPETIEAMAGGFEQLLAIVTADPEKRIRDIFSGDKQDQVSDASILADTDAPYPAKPLHQLIKGIAQQYPTNTAVQFGDTKLSYKQLDEASDKLAALLIGKGIQKGDLVALAVNRTADMMTALLGILKTGAAYLPIDPEYPVERIKYTLNDADAKLMIIPHDHRDHFVTDTEQLLIEDAIVESSAIDSPSPDVQVDPSDLAYVLYTSGTTGYPKGVQITHANLVNFLVSMQSAPGMKPADKLLAVTTISFDIAGLELFLPLITGACVVITDTQTARDGRALLQIVRDQQISMMQATPYTWKMLLEAGWNEQLPLKVLCGGEALPKDLAMKLLEKCGELWNMYGPTETTIWSTVKQVTPSDTIISIGKPIANTQVYILDEKRKAVPIGATGEIYISGDGVAPGYLYRDTLTRERFVADPFRPSATMYRTGDLGRVMPSGEIQCLGRTDQQLKIRGYRIEPEGIAQHIKDIHNVKDAVVTSKNDPAGNAQLVAYVVLRHKLHVDVPLQVKEWRDELRKHLQEYMVPNYIVILQALPLTPNGKIDIKSLPEPDYTQNRPAYVAPRTSIEKQVAEIWQQYMNIEKVGIYDDFFELGGHSLTAVEIMTALEKQTGQVLPLASLFNHATVERLALLLKMDGRSVTWDSLVPIKPLGDKMPLYIVHGAGLNVLLFNTLAQNMAPDQPVYGLQARGMNGIDEPLNRMEDIAGHYVSEILAQNPEGPYALAGYSFGGIIAYEMAKQLDQMGKRVKMLAMFDTYAYRSDYFDPMIKKLAHRAWFFIMQVLHSLWLLIKKPKDTFTYKSEMIRRRLIRKYWAIRYGREQQQEGFFGYSNKIDLMNEEAERNYKLEPYPIEVELFRAREVTFYMEDFKYLGWKKYALKGVNIHDIPGEHNFIFAPPNDKEFARVLQECLNKAEQKR